MKGLKARDGRLATIIGVFVFRNEDQGCSTGTFDRQGRGEAFLPLESRDKKFDGEAAVRMKAQQRAGKAIRRFPDRASCPWRRARCRGACVGEVSVLTGGPRTATVTAITDVTVATFARHRIQRILDANPRVRAVLEQLVEGRAKDTVGKLIGS